MQQVSISHIMTTTASPPLGRFFTFNEELPDAKTLSDLTEYYDMMDARVGNLFFTSNFDSGNLAKVEKVLREENESCSTDMKYDLLMEHQSVRPTELLPRRTKGYSGQELRPDYEYNVWTKPDCGGTEFENGNRSWFYFGVKGWYPNRLIKINVMNMNRQGKLYSQGHAPVVRTIPGKPKWERIRERPSFETVDGNFILTFYYRFPEVRGGMTYFAFCYPWSYSECQTQLSELDKKFENCKNLTSRSPPDTIYYHREILCHSLDKRNVDLITISSCHGICDQYEPRFDSNLFPDKFITRCKKFRGKRTYFLSSRVHPGETPSSFVFNGFLNFILREEDFRAKQLRRLFVFKLIPMLNPDGVARGHYRTDQRGVNLNRMYLDPSFKQHPSIYASKSLIVYHHIENRVQREGEKLDIHVDFPNHPVQEPDATSTTIPKPSEKAGSCSSDEEQASQLSNKSTCLNVFNLQNLVSCEVGVLACTVAPESFKSEWDENDKVMESSWSIQQPEGEDGLCHPPNVESLNLADIDGTDTYVSDSGLLQEGSSCDLLPASNCSSVLSFNDRMQSLHSRQRDNDLRLHLSSLQMSEEYKTSAATYQDGDSETGHSRDHLGNEGSEDEFDLEPIPVTNTNAPHLSDPRLHAVLPSDSGIAFYVDLHGHASKRGCFMYGNYFESEDVQVENMLYPRLIALNSAHFDFTACNFSERNMYSKDKRDGMSKEGSGRVAIFKAIGIISSYTLECNYNTGRLVNPVPPALGDDGRASPPPLAGFPPKYTPVHYEEVGRALAIAALDIHGLNPWSRLTLSEHASIHGVRDSVRRYLRSLRGGPRIPRNPPIRSLNRMNGMVGVGSSRLMRGVTSENSFQYSGSGSFRVANGAGFLKSNASDAGAASSTGLIRPSFSRLTAQTTFRKELAPVREATRISVSSSSQTRRRATFPISSSSQKVSSAPPTSASSTSVSLASTTAIRFNGSTEIGPYQLPIDNTLRFMEEDKIQQLKHCNLIHISQKPGPPSRIPLPTGRSNLHLNPQTVTDLVNPAQNRFISCNNFRTQKIGSHIPGFWKLADEPGESTANHRPQELLTPTAALTVDSEMVESDSISLSLPMAASASDNHIADQHYERGKRRKRFTNTKHQSLFQSAQKNSTKTLLRPNITGELDADFAVHGSSMDKKAREPPTRAVALSMTRQPCKTRVHLTPYSAAQLQFSDKIMGSGDNPP